MSGPAKGALCQVCNSPYAAQINAAVAAHVSGEKRSTMSAIASRFGVHKDALLRHQNNRHPGTIAPGKPSTSKPDEPPELSGSELDRLRASAAILEADFQKRPTAETSRELRLIWQRVAELEGQDAPKSVGVEDVEGLPELVAAWAEALEPYPEARAAMQRVTERLAPGILARDRG